MTFMGPRNLLRTSAIEQVGGRQALFIRPCRFSISRGAGIQTRLATFWEPPGIRPIMLRSRVTAQTTKFATSQATPSVTVEIALTTPLVRDRRTTRCRPKPQFGGAITTPLMVQCWDDSGLV